MFNETEIKEGNKLIIDFMGGKVFTRQKLVEWSKDTTISIKGFHNDWNLLMEVRNKINSLSIHHHITIFNTHTSVTVYNGGRGNNILYSKTENLDDSMLSTWKIIVEYIKWHNQNFIRNFKKMGDQYILV
jgi:hypothetical protein